MMIDGTEVLVEVLDGVAGRTPLPKNATISIDRASLVSHPMFSLTMPTVYIIEDRDSGAMLLVGAHIAQRCSYQATECE